MNDRRVVVVIEQDEEVRALLRQTLGDAGFEVHCAENGESGLELVRAKQPDTVTLDVVLPDMDGYEVARRIREFSHTYLLILSARSDIAATVMGFDAGADDYMVKPIRPRELRVRVDGMLRRPRRLVVVPPVLAEPAVTGALLARPVVVAPAAVAARYEHKGLQIDSATRAASIGGRTLELTRTEFDLLRILLERGTAVVSKAELAALLGIVGQDLAQQDGGLTGVFDAGRIIEAHVGNLRRKLGDDARSPKWLKTVRGAGYTLA
jgi:two-component system OmpR family response regulator